VTSTGALYARLISVEPSSGVVEERLRRRVRVLEQQLEARSREVVDLRARVDELEARTAPAGGTVASARAIALGLRRGLARRARRVIDVARRSVS
jgi:hypothetical protein